MIPAARALHLATGEPAGVHVADAWLRRRQLPAVICHEALECAALILSQPELQPDVALVGVTWLDPSEHAILDYLRERWPRIRIFVYGRDASRLVRRDDERMHGFDTVEAFAAALAQVQLAEPPVPPGQSETSATRSASRPADSAAIPPPADAGEHPAHGWVPAPALPPRPAQANSPGPRSDDAADTARSPGAAAAHGEGEPSEDALDSPPGPRLSREAFAASDDPQPVDGEDPEPDYDYDDWDAQVERELAAARGDAPTRAAPPPAATEPAVAPAARPTPPAEAVPPVRLDDPYAGELVPEHDAAQTLPPVVLTREELAALLRDEHE